MNNLKIPFSLILVLFSLKSFAADSTSTLESADTLYQNGNCEKAIPAYKAIPDSGLNQEQKDRVVFRTAYCQFSLSQYQDSEAGFKKYLSLHPAENEARLKYAQSLLFEAKYSEAANEAAKITSPDFKADAAIVIARSQIEAEDFSKAVETLKPYAENAEALYWTAVANYRSDSDAAAEQNFNLAIKKSNPNSWVQSEAKGWLSRMKEDKRKLHLRLTVGVLKDTNLDQSGGSGTITQGGTPDGPGGGTGPGGPGMTKPTFTSANYTAATGKYAAIDFIHNTYSSRKLNLTTTAAFSSPFYKDHSAYNQQSASLDMTLKAMPTSTFNYGASLKYQDTFYNKKYNQDYIYLTPTASWSFSPEYWLKFSIPVTKYLNNKQIKLYGGSLDFYYDPTNWVSFSAGASSTKSTGPTVSIKDFGSGPTLVSGTMFSHYTSTGAYLGVSFYILESFSLGVTASSYKSKYDLESIPGPLKHEPREDKLKSYQINLSKSFIQNVLSANFSYSHSKNESTGFPGLASSGSVSNNSYTRGYSLLTLEYYY